ncbi:hypothetical protein BT69DRAFT_1302074 [Atractiella rhizophila]|nr:hypothetical protein BT69DRAFT_1302074 [Atractiella rhizophila]
MADIVEIDMDAPDASEVALGPQVRSREDLRLENEQIRAQRVAETSSETRPSGDGTSQSGFLNSGMSKDEFMILFSEGTKLDNHERNLIDFVSAWESMDELAKLTQGRMKKWFGEHRWLSKGGQGEWFPYSKPPPQRFQPPTPPMVIDEDTDESGTQPLLHGKRNPTQAHNPSSSLNTAPTTPSPDKTLKASDTFKIASTLVQRFSLGEIEWIQLCDSFALSTCEIELLTHVKRIVDVEISGFKSLNASLSDYIADIQQELCTVMAREHVAKKELAKLLPGSLEDTHPPIRPPKRPASPFQIPVTTEQFEEARKKARLLPSGNVAPKPVEADEDQKSRRDRLNAHIANLTDPLVKVNLNLSTDDELMTEHPQLQHWLLKNPHAYVPIIALAGKDRKKLEDSFTKSSAALNSSDASVQEKAHKALGAKILKDFEAVEMSIYFEAVEMSICRQTWELWYRWLLNVLETNNRQVDAGYASHLRPFFNWLCSRHDKLRREDESSDGWAAILATDMLGLTLCAVADRRCVCSGDKPKSMI